MSELLPQPRDCAQAVLGKREYSQSALPFGGEEAPSAYSRLTDELSPLSLPPFTPRDTEGESAPPSERSHIPSAGTCWHPDHPHAATLVPLGTGTCWAHSFDGGQGSCGAQVSRGHQISPHPDHPPAATLVPFGTGTCWTHRYDGGQGSCGAQVSHSHQLSPDGRQGPCGAQASCGHQLSPHPDNPPCHWDRLVTQV